MAWPSVADLEEWELACVERHRLEELRFAAEELAVEARLLAGEHALVLADARVLAERSPLRERRWALLARAEYQSGRQADALRTLARARTILREDSGLDPDSELTELEAAILCHDPVLDVPAAPSTSRCCDEHESRIEPSLVRPCWWVRADSDTASPE